MKEHYIKLDINNKIQVPLMITKIDQHPSNKDLTLHYQH
jgi:hypothetical protein